MVFAVAAAFAGVEAVRRSLKLSRRPLVHGFIEPARHFLAVAPFLKKLAVGTPPFSFARLLACLSGQLF
jgi:hypothetical protein